MFGTRRLLFATALTFHATALPTADPDEDDSACWTSSSDYKTSSEQYEESYFTEFVTEIEHASTSTVTDVSMTTLCDGKARLLEPYKTITVTSTETVESPTPTVFQLPYTEPTPTCTIADSACAALTSAHHLGPKFCFLTKTVPDVPCTSDASQWCWVWYDARYATLLYWPVQTVSGDFCAQNGTVIAQPTSPPEPNKAVVDGITMTSPTNYISFDNIYADRTSKVGFRQAHRQCGGPAKENVVLPITESFYSGNYAGDQSWSFNFADLNTVPAEAYSRQSKCAYEPESCTGAIAVQAEYTPIINMDLDLADLKPEEWKAAGCGVAGGQAFGMQLVALATPAPTVVNKMLMN